MAQSNEVLSQIAQWLSNYYLTKQIRQNALDNGHDSLLDRFRSFCVDGIYEAVRLSEENPPYCDFTQLTWGEWDIITDMVMAIWALETI